MKPYLTNCCDLPGQISMFDSAENGGALQGTELWPTDLSMRNTGECPNADAEYTLAAILVDDPPTRYFLSVRAMDGILSRASRRGKQLMDELKNGQYMVWYRRTMSNGNPYYVLKCGMYLRMAVLPIVFDDVFAAALDEIRAGLATAAAIRQQMRREGEENDG